MGEGGSFDAVCFDRIEVEGGGRVSCKGAVEEEGECVFTCAHRHILSLFLSLSLSLSHYGAVSVARVRWRKKGNV